MRPLMSPSLFWFLTSWTFPFSSSLMYRSKSSFSSSEPTTQTVSTRSRFYRTLPSRSVTELAVVVHQDDLVQQVGRSPVQDAVDGPQQGGERLVEETDHYAGRG